MNKLIQSINAWRATLWAWHMPKSIQVSVLIVSVLLPMAQAGNPRSVGGMTPPDSLALRFLGVRPDHSPGLRDFNGKSAGVVGSLAPRKLSWESALACRDFVFECPDTPGNEPFRVVACDVYAAGTRQALLAISHPKFVWETSTQHRLITVPTLLMRTYNQPIRIPLLGYFLGGGRRRVCRRVDVVLQYTCGAASDADKVYEISVPNILINYPDHPFSDHAQYLDTMAERLNWKKSFEDLEQYQLQNVDELDRLLDVPQAFYGHGTGLLATLDLETLAPAKRERIIKAIHGLDDIPYAFYKKAARHLGVLCHQADYVEKALDSMRAGYPYQAVSAWDGKLDVQSAQQTVSIQSLQHYLQTYAALSHGQEQTFIDLIREVDSPQLFRSLMGWLWNADEEVFASVLETLARDEKPWIWSLAIDKLSMRFQNEFWQRSDLPNIVKLRMALLLNPNSDVQRRLLQDEAFSHLPGIMTPEFARMNFNGFSTIRRHAEAVIGRARLSEIDMGFMNQLAANGMFQGWSDISGAQYSIVGIVKDWNTWYDVNTAEVGIWKEGKAFGEHGGWVPKEFPALTQLVHDAVAWYEHDRSRQPVALSIQGLVVDAQGNPIHGATVEVWHIHNEINERGHEATEWTKIGACLSQDSGEFHFSGLKEGLTVLLKVHAPFFQCRERIRCWYGHGRYTMTNNKSSIVLRQLAGPEQ